MILTGTAAISVGFNSDASPLLPFMILDDCNIKNVATKCHKFVVIISLYIVLFYETAKKKV